MSSKRRQRLALLTKMRRLQQKRKGKQKVYSICEEEEEEEEEDEYELHEDDAPFVTFVEHIDDNTYEEEGMSTTTSQVSRPKLDRVQFHLEDGRVDVAEVFGHLNTCGLQYESKPGVWHDLRGMRTGKSAKKFKERQEVHIRKTGLSAWWNSKNTKSPWVDEWLVEGDTRSTYCARVSRLSHGDGGEVVGTTIRFENPYGLLLTAHHCCTFANPKNGELLTRNDLFAFNTSVEVVYLSDKYDLAFLLLKSGPYVGGFRLATRAEEKRGREVRMLSFPWHVDRAFGFDHENVGPTEVHGHIANLGPKERKLPIFVDALATYMGGFAASPGGAVTINSKVLAGMHIRAIWHQKGETILPFREQRKRSHRGGRQHCSVREDFAESSLRRESSKRKKRKRTLQDNNKGNIEKSSSRNETSKSKRPSEGNIQEQVERDGGAKCSMYHGYLSTYLSASRIQEEYTEFVSYWKVGGCSKKATSSEVDLFQCTLDEENHPKIRRKRRKRRW